MTMGFRIFSGDKLTWRVPRNYPGRPKAAPRCACCICSKMVAVVFVVRRLALLVAACSITCSVAAATFEDLAAQATAARAANHLPEAVKLYRQALEANSTWDEGWWYVGTILYDADDYKGCREALTQ